MRVRGVPSIFGFFIDVYIKLAGGQELRLSSYTLSKHKGSAASCFLMKSQHEAAEAKTCRPSLPLHVMGRGCTERCVRRSFSNLTGATGDGHYVRRSVALAL